MTPYRYLLSAIKHQSAKHSSVYDGPIRSDMDLLVCVLGNVREAYDRIDAALRISREAGLSQACLEQFRMGRIQVEKERELRMYREEQRRQKLAKRPWHVKLLDWFYGTETTNY